MSAVVENHNHDDHHHGPVVMVIMVMVFNYCTHNFSYVSFSLYSTISFGRTISPSPLLSFPHDNLVKVITDAISTSLSLMK